MFEGLDDPTPPVAGPGERAAVAARVSRIRRRRVYTASAGALAVVAIAVAVAQSLPDTSGLVSPAGVPTPGITPPGSPPERHEWGTGYTSCRVEDPGKSTAPAAGLRLHLDLHKRTYAAGDDVKGTLVVTNVSNTTVTFFAEGDHTDDGTLVAASGWASSARVSNDAVLSTQHRVAPGRSVRVPVRIRTTSCGTTRDSFEPLPAGHYQAIAVLHWTAHATFGDWWSSPVPVTLA